MKTPRGYVHGYNAQAVVTADQIIVAADVTQEAHDIKQLYPMLAQTQAQLHAIEYPPPIGTALADAGSGSEANLTEANPTDPALLLATNKDGQPVKRGREIFATRTTPPVSQTASGSGECRKVSPRRR